MAVKRWIPETLFDALGFRMTFAVERVLYETQTEHQHLVLFQHQHFGKVLMLDGATHRVTWRGHALKIGPTEFKLLHYLMRHPERVHSRSQLLDKVWGDHVFIEERTVDVHVKRLREALAPVQCATLIETVRGAGYRLTQQAAAAPVAAEERAAIR